MKVTRTCKSFRDEACAALKGNWGLAVGATLIYMILYGAFSAGTELSGGFGSVICSLLVLLIGEMILVFHTLLIYILCLDY